MIVGLVSSEKQHVWILLDEIGDDGIAIASMPSGIARQGSDDNLVLAAIIGTNGPLELGVFSVTDTIRNAFAFVPSIDSKMGRPAVLIYRGPSHFLPLAIDLQL